MKGRILVCDMEPVRVRPALSEELDLLWSIDQSCFQAEIAYSRQELAAFMAIRDAVTLVAEAGGVSDAAEAAGSRFPTAAAPLPHTASGRVNIPAQVLGFIIFEGPRSGRGHVTTIDVLAHGRGRGVGLALMHACERILRERGAHFIVLEAAVNNAPALRFYQKLGYTILRELPHYYPGGLNGLLLRKPL